MVLETKTSRQPDGRAQPPAPGRGGGAGSHRTRPAYRAVGSVPPIVRENPAQRTRVEMIQPFRTGDARVTLLGVPLRPRQPARDTLLRHSRHIPHAIFARNSARSPRD